jgi:hypothetical protein
MLVTVLPSHHLNTIDADKNDNTNGFIREMQRWGGTQG